MAKMSIAAFLRTAEVLPSWASILMRGRTVIGKSQLVRQLAHRWGFTEGDVIGRRRAQMCEGDVIGLRSADGKVIRFNAPDG